MCTPCPEGCGNVTARVTIKDELEETFYCYCGICGFFGILIKKDENEEI